MADARTGKRFPVELPIRIHTQGSVQDQAGTTENVSAAGVYIRTEAHSPDSIGSSDGPLHTGSMVEFDMTLPADVVGAEKDVEIHCCGRVVRVDEVKDDAERQGLACVIDNYEFKRKR